MTKRRFDVSLVSKQGHLAQDKITLFVVDSRNFFVISVQEMEMEELCCQVKALQEKHARFEVDQQGHGRTSNGSNSNGKDNTNPFHYSSSTRTRPNVKLKGTLEPIMLNTWESKLISLSLKGGSNQMISLVG